MIAMIVLVASRTIQDEEQQIGAEQILFSISSLDEPIDSAEGLKGSEMSCGCREVSDDSGDRIEMG